MSYQRNYYGNLKYDENTDTYTSYSVYYNVLAVDKSTFNNNTTIVGVDFNDLPFVDDDMSGAFSQCISLQQVLNLSDSVTNMANAFAGCKFTAVPISSIPESVVNMTGTFSGCDNLITAPTIPENVESLELTFSNCTNLTGNMNICSAKISNATDCFSGTTNSKNVYIPFKDSNNNNTMTYNSFIAAGYNTSGTTNGVYLKELVNYTLTINPIPSDSVVTFVGDGTVSADGKSITVLPNTSITYTVSSDYDTVSHTIVVVNDSTITVNTQELDWSNSIVERNFSLANEIENVSIAYNGSKYILTLYTYDNRHDEYYSYISTSTDGIMWTTLVSIDDYDYRNYIAYGNNKFVILDDYGRIMISNDGEIWSSKTVVSNLGNNNWGHIVYGNDKFIALCYGTSGYISTSIDGTNWTLAEQNSTLSNYTWSDLIYDGSKFIVLSTNGYISTSTDGTNWTTPIQDSNLNGYTWKSIAYDNSRYIVLSYNGFISVSTDCINWTTPARELPNLGNSNGWIHIDYNGNNFVAFSEYMNYIIYTKSENTPDLTLTVNPIPSDATVTFDSSGIVSGNSITVQYGSYATYSVDKSGYKSIKSAFARPTSIDTQIDVTLVDLGIWQFVGTPNKSLINRRYDFNYSSYYDKYYSIVDAGYDSSTLEFTSDFINYTTYTGYFGVLPSGQIVKLFSSINYDSSTKVYTIEVKSQLLNSDLTWTTSTLIYSEDFGTRYPTGNYFYNGYIINGSLCFPTRMSMSTTSSKFMFIYTTDGINWNNTTFHTDNTSSSRQLTPLGSNGNYAVMVLGTNSGFTLYKFTTPTSKTVGSVLWTGGNMTGAAGYYDKYSFNYDNTGDYSSYYSHYTIDGTTGLKYQGKTYEGYVSHQQRYVAGRSVYINTNRSDTTKLAVLSADFNTKYYEMTTPFKTKAILGLIDRYIYIRDEDGDVYRTDYIENILDLI